MRSDAVLAERVAGGDEAAFDVLYERHRAVVLAVCMGILGAAHDAEDATQETFAALSIALRTNIPPELRPWLIRVARNASIDTTRRRKHRLLTLDGELPEIPVRPATGKAEFAVVMDGIRELPEQQRTALLMRELGGHSYAEIGDFMQLDEPAVRGLIARARVGLRNYREATELPCATARACIETEPDGRRYDKTIRRHLRGCASCRSYRTALRRDARALRAALPFQTGAFSGAGGGFASGSVGAGKAALVGAGMTQIAATCAASVCVVGTVGGMVLIAPINHLLGDRVAKPAAALVAKPRHHHASHLASALRQPVVVHVSSGASRDRTGRHKTTGAAGHKRGLTHVGSSASSAGDQSGSGVAAAGTASHQGGSQPPTTSPAQTPATGAGTASSPVSGSSGTTSVTSGSGSGSSGTTSVTSGSGAVSGGTAATGVGTVSTATSQSPLTPVTDTVNNVLQTVASGLSGQSASSGSAQSTTTASTPLGL